MARDKNRSLAGQGARIRGMRQQDLLALLQELTRITRSKGVQTTKVDSAGLNLTIIERRPTTNVVVGVLGTTYDVLGDATSSIVTVPVKPTVDSLLLAHIDCFMDPTSSAMIGDSQVESWVTVDGTSWSDQAAVYRGWNGTSPPKASMQRLLCIPLRAGNHSIGWKAKMTTGAATWNLTVPYSRLILILTRLDNADVVAKL